MPHTARHAAAEARRNASILRDFSLARRWLFHTPLLKACFLLFISICIIAADIHLPEMAAAKTNSPASSTAQANAILAKAEAEADKLKYQGADSDAYLSIAMAYTETGNIPAAKRIAAAIVGAHQKASAYIHLAQWQASHNDAAGARETWAAATTAVADMPEHLFGKASMYEDILKAQAKAGDVTGAQSTLDAYMKLKDTANTQTDTRFPGYHREMMAIMAAHIANAQARAGDASGARATLAAATTTASNEIDHTAAGFISSLGKIAWTQAKMGDEAGREKTLEIAREIMVERKTDADARSDESMKVTLYCELARAQAILSDMAGSKATLAAATDIARSIADKEKQSWAYFTIAYAQLGLSRVWSIAKPDTMLPPSETTDVSGAKKTALLITDSTRRCWIYQDIVKAQVAITDFNNARETANLITKADDKTLACLHLAEALMNSGDMDGARETLIMARNAAKDIPDNDIFMDSVDAYRDIAMAMARAGDVAGAIATAELIPDTVRKAYANCDIARAQANAGDLAGAMKSLDTAKITADAMTDANTKSALYNDIMPTRAKAGDVPAAEKWAASMPNPNDRINAYVDIACALVSTNTP